MKIVYFGTKQKKPARKHSRETTKEQRIRQKLKEKIGRKCFLYGGALVLLLACGLLLEPAAKMVFQTAAGGERKLPIYCVETEEPKIAISFDAAWGADDTDTLLQILEEYHAPATFFLCGYWVEKYPEEVQKIAAAGHTLGNHSSTHPHMNSLSADQILEELEECHDKVQQLTGQDMELFRPPFGEYNNTVIETATSAGYYTIQWDVDTNQTERKALA